MILDKSIVSLVNMQIVREQEASHAYKASALWCNAAGFQGSEAYFTRASAEELSHRDTWMQYLVGMGAQPVVPAVDAITAKFGGLRAVFSDMLQREQNIAKAISELYAAAMAMSDYLTAEMLHWFLAEQRNSLIEVMDILRWFDAFGVDLAMIDAKVGGIG